jgi:hypothetical protein
MAKSPKERRRQRRKEKARAALAPAEQAANRRAAEATTVAWMLAVLATLGAEVLAIGGVILVAVFPREDESPGLLNMIPGSLGFSALVTGAVCLILTPVVRRLRDVPPPRVIEVAALVAGGIPWLLLLISLLAKFAQ